MRITNKLNINLSRQEVPEILNAVQGDANTRVVELHLQEGGGAWNVPEGVTAAVSFRKPDGHKGLYDTLPNGAAAVTVAGSVVTATLAPQVLSCAGDVAAAVVLCDKNLNRLATFPFTIHVAPDPSAGKALSNDYYRYSTMEAVSKEVEAALAALEAEKQAFLTDTAPAIVCQATGETVKVTDASNRPLQGLTLYGKTTQNGTPTPDAPVALKSAGESGSIGVTVSGKNLLRLTETRQGYYRSADGSFAENGTWVTVGEDDYAPVLKGETYCISSKGAEWSRLTVLYYDVNKKYLTSKDFYSAANNTKLFVADYTGFVKVQFNQPSGITANAVTEIQLESGSIASNYEPYKEIQASTAFTPNGLPGIPVTSDGNYTDENGQQWVCDEVDLERGVYVQRVQKRELTGTEACAEKVYTGMKAFQLGLPWNKTATLEEHAWSLSTHFACTNSTWSTMPNNTIQVYGTQFMIRCDNFATVDKFKAWLAERYASGNPVTMQYILATPIEMPLSNVHFDRGNHDSDGNHTALPWNASASPNYKTTLPTGGNYYLTEDVTLAKPHEIAAGKTLTLCLNGKTLSSTDRVFSVYGILNITDCADKGTIKGNTGDKAAHGGVFYLYPGSIMNVCGGNLQGNASATAIKNGGVGYVQSATLNLYAGTISGGKTTGYGGNIYLAQSTLNMYGGAITGGYASSQGGGNVAVNANSTFYLYDGTVTNGTTPIDGGNIRVASNSNLAIIGGIVTRGSSSAGGNVYVNALTCKVTISDGTVTDATKGGNVYLNGGATLTNGWLAKYESLHTNKPNTTVYNDSGAGMGVSYAADTKMYIDNKFAQISAAILNA